ncbi:ECF transporter S component [Streptococcus dentiloxodontae]
MRSDKTRLLVEMSLFAALIFISIQALRIPVGPQFVHFGNALVVIAVLIYGVKRGALIAAVGLGIFDIFNGYAAEVWLTILEAWVVCLIIYFVFEKWLKGDDKLIHIIIVAISAAVIKIIMNAVEYTLTGVIVGNLSWSAAFLAALVNIGGTFGTSLVTAISVPILYPIFKKILGRKES